MEAFLRNGRTAMAMDRIGSLARAPRRHYDFWAHNGQDLPAHALMDLGGWPCGKRALWRARGQDRRVLPKTFGIGFGRLVAKVASRFSSITQ